MKLLSGADGQLDDFQLAELYAYPRARWLRANMVSSADKDNVRQGAQQPEQPDVGG